MKKERLMGQNKMTTNREDLYEKVWSKPLTA